MEQVKVLVTGANGQLGKCFHKVENKFTNLNFHFVSRREIDITKSNDINVFLKNRSFDYIVNCAAYTNVEQAEKEPEEAYKINAEAVKLLAQACKKYDITLIHISTDYVFDGCKNTPYFEQDTPKPINEYGKSKLEGEQYILQTLKKYFIIRTSWLYSEFGKNFYKMILEKSKTQDKLTIIDSEIGTPTNANDLARFILNMIDSESTDYGIYHCSNEGEATWYDFAREILQTKGNIDSIKLEKTEYYPTFAKRPKYSVLDKSKIKKVFGVEILQWKKSLEELTKN